jgi:signal peptidase I
MEPTILVGDLVFVDKVAYDLKVPFTTWHMAEWGNPKHGDIVVCFSPKDGLRLVKRVVGVPGDEVELRNDRLFLNGVPMAYGPVAPSVVAGLSPTEKSNALFATEVLAGRDHAMMVMPQRSAMRTFGPLRVPAGSYFVMGDNRDNSNDSRYFGFVPRDQIVGEAKMVLASANWSAGVRWGRFFSALN